MTWLLILGVIVTVAGLGGLGLCIKRAAAARSLDDPDAVRTHLQGLVALNLASVGLSGLGLAMVVIALIL